MPYLIDGHNLIGKLPDISLSDIDDEISLFNLLEKYFKTKRKKATVYFDKGNPLISQKVKGAFVKAKFIKDPSSADEAIILKLKQLGKNAKNYTIVTSDQWIENVAIRSGAAVISSTSFSDLLNMQKESSNPSKTHNPDVEYWLNIFKKES